MNNMLVTVRATLTGLLCTVVAGTAVAQIEEIVVTAQKREQSAQDVGLTISAFDEDRYRELAGGDLDRFAGQLTNVQAYAPHSFLQSVHVRGIGLNEFQGQYDSPVATHVDEVYIAKPWMLARPVYDIQRVEVLKGPQGTLFGRNTTGGALNWYTNPPSDKFSAGVEFRADEHERYMAEGFVNGPLADQLDGRISFHSEVGNGGPQKNLLFDNEHGKPNLFDFRGQLKWEGEKLTVRALAHGGVNKGETIAWKGPGIFNLGAPTLCPQVFTGEVSKHPSSCAKFAGLAIAAGRPEGEYEPEDKFTINQNTPPAVDDTFYGGYLRFEYDLGWSTLTSITAYEYYERNHREDSQSDIFNSTSTHYYNEMNQITQELRLTGEMTARWRYLVGLFYENDDLDQVDGSDLSGQILPGVTPIFPTATPGVFLNPDQFMAQFHLDLDSIAAFFNSEFDVTDNVTINAGVRYTQDSIKVSDAFLGIGLKPQVGKEDYVTHCLNTTFVVPTYAPACPDLALVGFGPEPPGGYADNRTDTNISWRAGVEWKPVEDWLIYANLTTGYRSGGYSLPFAGAATQFKPEKLFAQEIGVKAQLFDNTLQINASAFKYDYDSVQVNVDDPVSPLVPITRNVGTQQNKGLEAEGIWQPNERWYLRQGVGYLDARYEKSDRVITTYLGPVPLKGKRPVNSPEWTYNGVVRYQQPIFDGWDGIVMFDYRWVDDRFLEATDQAFEIQKDYWVANARIAVASQDGSWELAFFGNNLFDEEYITYVNNIAFFKLDIYGETQTFGASLRYRYE